jgi:hypothetical protein
MVVLSRRISMAGVTIYHAQFTFATEMFCHII